MLLETRRINTAGRERLQEESKGKGDESAKKAESLSSKPLCPVVSGFFLWNLQCNCLVTHRTKQVQRVRGDHMQLFETDVAFQFLAKTQAETAARI